MLMMTIYIHDCYAGGSGAVCLLPFCHNVIQSKYDSIDFIITLAHYCIYRK